MRKSIKFFGLFLTILVVMGCKVEPQPIAYGFDVCTFCTMTIIDQQHASQLLTVKGRVSKFDAIECMIQYTQSVEEEKIGMLLCANYSNPGALIDATQATFLICPELPSPMGADLTAFENKEQALLARGKAAGALYSWEEVRKKIMR